MKKIIYLLFLPIMGFGQPIGQLQNDMVAIEFRMEIALQNEYGFSSNEFEKSQLALLLTIVIPMNELGVIEKSRYSTDHIVHRAIPKSLHTFSISGLYPQGESFTSPQKRLDNLIAMNDPDYPKENSLLKGLRPIQYKNVAFGGAENMPSGFGPTIRL